MERKNSILEMLYKNRPEWLSGEEISNKLGISRTAVWKHINSLRESGYIIESSSRNGHKLISCGNNFSEYEIKRNLKTEIFGQKEIHIFSETDSSNIQAFKKASAGAPEGSIVVADSQTGGKGRLGRKWISPAGKNLYISLILRPKIPTYTAPRLTLVAAVALSDTLNDIGALNHRIKWPNDILSGERKLSGILTEMKGDCDTIDFIIVGLGINLNSSPSDYPDDIKNIFISAGELTGKTVDRIEFLKLLLIHFEKSYSHFIEGRFPEILEKWSLKSSIIGRKIKVTNFEESFTGTVTGITPEGNLTVLTENGTCDVNSGDIHFI